MLKRLIIFFFAFLIPINVSAYSAQSYCVIDSESKRILAASNETQKLGMASTTKIMTALVALNNSKPEDIVTISKNASYTEGSSLYLKEGEKIKMIDLIYGLMLNSGNDAAVAIAEHISGNTEEFAKLMTKTAHELGAVNTNFVNPNGLSDDMHYTTAFDLAIITAKALENKDFAEIVATKKYSAKTLNTEHMLYYNNHNKLLNMLEDCNGVKTGFTKATGRCLVSSVTRNDWTAICVTLNAPDDWNDHKNLYDNVYSNFSLKRVLGKDAVLKSVRTNGADNNGIVDIVCPEDVNLVLSENEHVRIDLNKITDNFTLPLKKGDSLGDVQFFLDNELIVTKKAVTYNKMDLPIKITFLDKVFDMLYIWVNFCT